MVIATSVGSQIVGWLVVIVFGAGWILAKLDRYSSTRCAHCGHDSGVSGWQAPVCPACGRKRTVLSTRRARKR